MYSFYKVKNNKTKNRFYFLFNCCNGFIFSFNNSFHFSRFYKIHWIEGYYPYYIQYLSLSCFILNTFLDKFGYTFSKGIRNTINFGYTFSKGINTINLAIPFLKV